MKFYAEYTGIFMHLFIYLRTFEEYNRFQTLYFLTEKITGVYSINRTANIHQPIAGRRIP